MKKNEEEMKLICQKINLLVDVKLKDFKKLKSFYRIEDNANVAIKTKLNEIENRIYF